MGHAYVHWDMPAKQSEVLAQRNWRLDRRVSNEWERQNYSNEFRITYLINTQKDRRSDLNSHYSKNRRFLGHRGHIQHPEENSLIPTTDNEWSVREWSPEPQNCMGTNSFQAQRLFDYLDGNVADHDGLASAFLNRSILELLAIEPHGMDSIYNDGIEFTGYLGLILKSTTFCYVLPQLMSEWSWEGLTSTQTFEAHFEMGSSRRRWCFVLRRTIRSTEYNSSRLEPQKRPIQFGI